MPVVLAISFITACLEMNAVLRNNNSGIGDINTNGDSCEISCNLDFTHGNRF